MELKRSFEYSPKSYKNFDLIESLVCSIFCIDQPVYSELDELENLRIELTENFD